MRIVDRATFLAMPAGTVYMKYEPCNFGSLAIKADTCGPNDFVSQEVSSPGLVGTTDSGQWGDTLDQMQETGEDVPIDWDSFGRDALYDAHQLFAVLSEDDVRGLIGLIATPPR